MAATLIELAQRFDCDYRGDADREVTRVGTLANADASAVSFLANPTFRAQLASTQAGIVILEEKFAAQCPTDSLIHSNPYATYARIAAYLHPPVMGEAGVHATAAISGSARVAATASIGPQAAIGGGAVIGERAVIGAGQRDRQRLRL